MYKYLIFFLFNLAIISFLITGLVLKNEQVTEQNCLYYNFNVTDSVIRNKTCYGCTCYNEQPCFNATSGYCCDRICNDIYSISCLITQELYHNVSYSYVILGDEDRVYNNSILCKTYDCVNKIQKEYIGYHRCWNGDINNPNNKNYQIFLDIGFGMLFISFALVILNMYRSRMYDERRPLLS